MSMVTEYRDHLRTAKMHIQKFVLDVTLHELLAAQRDPQTPTSLQKLVEKMEKDSYPVQGGSAMYYTKDGFLVFVYLGHRSRTTPIATMVHKHESQSLAVGDTQDLDECMAIALESETTAAVKSKITIATIDGTKTRLYPLEAQHSNGRLAATLEKQSKDSATVRDQHLQAKEAERVTANKKVKRSHYRQDAKTRPYIDGLASSLIVRYYISVHMMGTYNPPKGDSTAKRHGVMDNHYYQHFRLEDGVEFTASTKEKDTREKVYSEDDGWTGTEIAGLLHLVEAWKMQGHPQGVRLYSSYKRPSDIGIEFAPRKRSRDQAALEVFFPEVHAIAKATRAAGRMIPGDGGAYLGRAVIFKLQLLPSLLFLGDSSSSKSKVPTSQNQHNMSSNSGGDVRGRGRGRGNPDRSQPPRNSGSLPPERRSPPAITFGHSPTREEGDSPFPGTGSAGARYSPYSRDHSRSRSTSTARASSSRTRSREGSVQSQATAPPSVRSGGDQYERQTHELELNMGIGDSDMEADEAAINGALEEIQGWLVTHDNGRGLSRNLLQSIGLKARALFTACLVEPDDEDETVRLTDTGPTRALTAGTLTALVAGGSQGLSRDGDASMADTPMPAVAPQPPERRGTTTISVRRGPWGPRGPPPRVNRATRPKNAGSGPTTYASAARRGGASANSIVALARSNPSAPASRILQASAVVEGKGKNARNTRATPSYTSSGPSRKQVLVSFPRGGEAPSLNLSLVTATVGAALRNRGRSLKVLSTKPAYDGWSISTSAVATTPEVEIIEARIRDMVPSEFKNSLWVGLPTSTSFLKVLDVPYYSTRGDRSPVTAEEVIEQFRSSPLREDLGCISGKPRVVHNSSKSTTAT
ncbi:hypothetical protein PQX77_019548, partial [Marasmius sp. AFHP31]